VRNFEFEAQPTEFLPIEFNSQKYNNIIIYNDQESEIHVIMIFYSSNSFGYHYPKSK
jgi:hypothetical protein